MEKQIWVIGSDRREMLEAQRRINSTGSMRALCMLSFAAVKRAVENSSQEAAIGGSMPSLVIMDYQTAVEEDFQSVSFLKMQQFLAGVPLFFMIGERSQEVDEQCFLRGGMVVVEKPFSHASILRIEQVAWQHEVTRNYEKVLQKQAMDLQAAREIVRLNQIFFRPGVRVYLRASGRGGNRWGEKETGGYAGGFAGIHFHFRGIRAGGSHSAFEFSFQ